MKIKYTLLCLALLTVSCSKLPEKLFDEGVSLELAQFRAANYSDVRYGLEFSLHEDKSARVEASAAITVTLDSPHPVILDFTGTPEDIKMVEVNGKPADWTLDRQHIVIPAKFVRKGENVLSISFTAGDQSLNRRDEFLYTLLVPDRARTLFPCFDQPDLKARFSLALEIPGQWEAVGNGSRIRREPFPEGDGTGGRKVESGRKLMEFRETELIPTYLFSFVAGEFRKYSVKNDGRPITLYHRETDPAKVAQCSAILDEVSHSLAWLEDYTAIPYPFEKYDLIILPGFQYGGMEHMGATLYNDRRMFLDPNPTDAELLARSSLIAHETAHMWFGDFVTMKWFNDVWNKEVFANWFAAKIVEPMYPDINHALNFTLSYFPSAYAEDRTGGAMPIQQHLGNLSDAGLIYSNIIYNKSPIVMDMLVRKVGDDKFREAIHEYLNTYAYGNADWDGLVAILDSHSEEDLRAWSDTWVREKGMPTVSAEKTNDRFTVRQSDPWGRDGIEWEQDVEFLSVFDGDELAMDVLNTLSETEVVGGNYQMPNSDGRGYGYFEMDKPSAEWVLERWGSLPLETLRLAALMNLYEGALNLAVDPADFVGSVMKFAATEKNFQIFNQAISYAESCVKLFGMKGGAWASEYENFLLGLAGRTELPLQYRMQAMRSFYRTAASPGPLAELERIWRSETLQKRYNLGEGDLINISYELAVRFPEKANEITAAQLSRIPNPDRRKEYEYVSQAVNPSREARDGFFRSLLLEENRQVEPWAATALRLLNHPSRYPESLEYIRPGLDALEEVQRTGDIFFPANWCAALLGGHSSREALEIVERFLSDNPGYPPLLASKIRLRADHLYITNGVLEKRYSTSK